MSQTVLKVFVIKNIILDSVNNPIPTISQYIPKVSPKEAKTFCQPLRGLSEDITLEANLNKNQKTPKISETTYHNPKPKTLNASYTQTHPQKRLEHLETSSSPSQNLKSPKIKDRLLLNPSPAAYVSNIRFSQKKIRKNQILKLKNVVGVSHQL